MALYRNTLATRAERADELEEAIATTRRELAELETEAASLSRRWQEAIDWVAAPSATTRFRRGVALGLGFVFMLPLLLVTVFAGSGLPLAALFCFLR